MARAKSIPRDKNKRKEFLDKVCQILVKYNGSRARTAEELGLSARCLRNYINMLDEKIESKHAVTNFSCSCFPTNEERLAHSDYPNGKRNYTE